MTGTERSPPPPWSPPPRWYPDPEKRQQRYWDGQQWTDRSRRERNRVFVAGLLVLALGIVLIVGCLGIGVAISLSSAEYSDRYEVGLLIAVLGILLGAPIMLSGVVTAVVGLSLAARNRHRPRVRGFSAPRVSSPSSSSKASPSRSSTAEPVARQIRTDI